MSVFKRGSIYWYEFVFQGQRIRESTDSKSKEVAVQAEAKRRRDLEESFNGVTPKRRLVFFPQAAEAWLEAKRAPWSKSNIAIQGYNLRHLTEYFGKMALPRVSSDDIGKYQSKRQDERASNRTINMEVATLRMILKHNRLWAKLLEKGEVKMLPERKDIGRALTREEEDRLLAACRQSASHSLCTAVVVLSNIGVRGAELRTARWSQVNFLGKTFQVGKAKTEGSEGRVIPLNQAAFGALQDWRAQVAAAKPDGYIFPSEKLAFKGKGATEQGIMTPYRVDLTKPLGSWKRAWRTAKTQAGVECRMHDLRHSFVSKLAETQTPDATIQALSGHLTKKMLDHYSHVRNEAKRQAVSLLDSMHGQTVQ